MKILIVDDLEVIVETTKEMLDKLGDFEVFVAFDGIEAVSLYENETPDVVFMDVRMPNMDGCLASSLIKMEYPNAIIYGVSSDTNIGCKDNFKELFTKPLTVNKLKDIINAV